MPPGKTTSLGDLETRLRAWYQTPAPPSPRVRPAVRAPRAGQAMTARAPAPPPPASPAEAVRAARKAARAQKSEGPMADPGYRIYYEATVLELKHEHPEKLGGDESGAIYGTAHVIAKRHMAKLARVGRCKKRGCVRAKHAPGTYHLNAIGLRF